MINCCSDIKENEQEAKQIIPGRAQCVLCFKCLQAEAHLLCFKDLL